MKQIIYGLWLTALFQPILADLTFAGLIENPSITKNNFLCHSDQETSSDCNNADKNYIGAVLTDNTLLQLFNNQSYFLKQEQAAQKYDAQVLRDSGSQLQEKLNSQGYSAMGGYCIIITKNPTVTGIVMPNMIAQKNQEKVVVQLWYNANRAIQLWSQDAALLTAGQSFKVSISNEIDPLTTLQTPANKNSSLKASFLTSLGIQTSNRKESVYHAATESPRLVKIVTD
jgi:hypothetical protein